jgi:hypothetical protein
MFRLLPLPFLPFPSVQAPRGRAHLAQPGVRRPLYIHRRDARGVRMWKRGCAVVALAARANPHSLVCRPSLSLARDLAPCVVIPSVPQLPRL